MTSLEEEEHNPSLPPPQALFRDIGGFGRIANMGSLEMRGKRDRAGAGIPSQDVWAKTVQGYRRFFEIITGIRDFWMQGFAIKGK